MFGRTKTTTTMLVSMARAARAGHAHGLAQNGAAALRSASVMAGTYSSTIARTMTEMLSYP
jgi:hypothetical protein